MFGFTFNAQATHQLSDTAVSCLGGDRRDLREFRTGDVTGLARVVSSSSDSAARSMAWLRFSASRRAADKSSSLPHSRSFFKSFCLNVARRDEGSSIVLSARMSKSCLRFSSISRALDSSSHEPFSPRNVVGSVAVCALSVQAHTHSRWPTGLVLLAAPRSRLCASGVGGGTERVASGRQAAHWAEMLRMENGSGEVSRRNLSESDMRRWLVCVFCERAWLTTGARTPPGFAFFNRAREFRQRAVLLHESHSPRCSGGRRANGANGHQCARATWSLHARRV